MKNKSISYLQHKFVEFIPNMIETGIIYISMENSVAIHKCACGCHQEVVTPFAPTDWKLIYDGGSVTLYPSIGNWSFTCRSHYWIRKNRIQWAENWSQSEVEWNRKYDKALKLRHYKQAPKSHISTDETLFGNVNKFRVWKKLKRIFRI